MPALARDVKFFMPKEEQEIISSLLLGEWVETLVPNGKLAAGFAEGFAPRPDGSALPHVYTMINMIIVTKSGHRVVLEVEPEEDQDSKAEFFRVSVFLEAHHLDEHHHPFREVVDPPSDLAMESFLGVENAISLLRFYDGIESSNSHQINVEVDAGLLISNHQAKMVLCPAEQPMDIAIATHPETVGSILEEATVVSLIKQGGAGRDGSII